VKDIYLKRCLDAKTQIINAVAERFVADIARYHTLIPGTSTSLLKIQNHVLIQTSLLTYPHWNM
jgi:hypothetical protein